MSKPAAGGNPVLNYHLRATTPATLTPYLGLLLDVEAGTEESYTSYARVLMSSTYFGNAAASNAITNTAPIQFPPATSDGGTVKGVGIWDAASAGNLIRKAYLVSGYYYVFTAASGTDVFTAPGHALADNDRVIVMASPNVSLPTGVTQGTIYYVITTVGSTSFQLSTTQGGAAVDITVFGAGMVAKIIPQIVLNTYVPTFNTGALTFKEY